MVKNELTAEQETLAETVTTALRNADTNIRAAILAASAGGVTANEIARRADVKLTGVRGYSRPIILEILGAEDIRSRAIAALQDNDIRVSGDKYDDEADMAVWEGAARSVWIRLTEAMRGRSAVTRGNLANNADNALRAAGLGLCQGESTFNMAETLAGGETVEIYDL